MLELFFSDEWFGLAVSGRCKPKKIFVIKDFFAKYLNFFTFSYASKKEEPNKKLELF
jgi:hypothetical protein